MLPPDPADASACATCGRPWADVDGGRGWLHLEVTRSDEAEGLRFLDADFCTQEHAAQWLARPLPDPVAPELHGATWPDRLAAAWVVLLVVLAAALTGLGAWTAGAFLLGLV
ncbi:hypothetical protein E9549_09230 [Blastococcus sp. MG754426]|uniref:hypothetical protein n=1 Tax=unclassified Blastococcus TaxID=2619396 RepID=UPI001EF14156|nr:MULTISPECIES: hypothetical protein [unclassified Blastococcus]MCF6507586.1 hypothetical protein [Blastococcus sp. MG754426]MCF6511978.1 hypothetical protein [Blastococcus sp. MG754427]